VSDDDFKPVSVSRRIGASAEAIFRVLADPSQHTRLDGTDMLRGAVTAESVSGVGDVFIMRMFYAEHGDYEMNNHVVEYELNRRIGWEPAPGHGHPGFDAAGTADARWGHRWIFDLAPDGPVTAGIRGSGRHPQSSFPVTGLFGGGVGRSEGLFLNGAPLAHASPRGPSKRLSYRPARQSANQSAM